MSGAAEDVLLMVNRVKHKKRDGVLYLMAEHIAWCQQGKDHFESSDHYSDIKCQKVSPEGKAKIQLQVVLLSGESKIFHFADSDAQKCKEQRNSVKDILSEMLPKFRRRIDKVLEEKNRILQEDPELFQIYKDLVTNQAITPDEFWTAHSSKLFTDKSGSSQQKVGVSASFLADVKPQSDGCNGLRYNLTADRINSIFRTYPAVKKKYLDKVPDKMTEREFWTMFFQSHYFHRERVNQSSKDIFSDCSKKDDQDVLSLLKIGVKDPFVNLVDMADQDLSTDEGYGASSAPILPSGKVKQSSTQLMNKAIIKRFNHQSAMILSTSANGDSTQNGGANMQNGDTDDVSAAKKMKLQETTQHEDLTAEAKAEDPTLNLQKSERYSHGPTILSEVHEELNSRAILDGLNAVANQCASYRPRFGQVLTSSNAVAALKDLSVDSRSRGGVNENFIDQILTEGLKTELQHLYASTEELLRHFWSCFPVNTPFLQEKIVRLYSSIVKFHEERLQSFKQSLVDNRVEVNVTEHLEEMLNAAVTKYKVWNEKANKRR